MATSKKSTASKKTSKSSSKTTYKKVAKSAVKAAKKSPVAAIIIVVVLIALAIGGFFAYKGYLANNPKIDFALIGSNAYSIGLNTTYKEKGVKATYNGEDVSGKVTISYFEGNEKTPVEKISTDVEKTFYVDYTLKYEKADKKLERIITVTDTASISINFLELGNKYTGDSVYIKAGETDILIDAGSRGGSSEAIASYLNQPGRVEDGTLEYVIATHAHQDHIAGFVGTKASPGIFKRYKCETIIDFARTGASSGVYNDYVAERDAEVKDDGAKHFTALECWNSSKEGAQRTYELAPGINMDILYQKYYETDTNDENNYSVCVLISQGENNYLFTGDLEKEGESSLVDSNSLPEVTLFKGAHHGSYTANTDKLLNAIKPQVVCVCCCAGSDEYTKEPLNMFPAQDAINRLGKWTDKIYVTTIVDDSEKGYKSMNGNIQCTSIKGNGLVDFTVHGSNNDTILKETNWFKNNRTWPTA
ncbi:MAG: MBL fold metallo-hydrolase [Bacilli bacterium]|nr:MBL fold metallo-hydrolase [Bacilli bacterium]